MFLLRPCIEVTTAVRFAYLLSALRFGIQLHATVVMSNHVHIVATDPDGLLPAFLEEANRLISRSLNAFYGRKESFWAPGSYTDQECTSPEAALDRMVYTITNPVKARLVSKVKQWPGWVTLPEELDGRAQTAKRPTFFYREDGATPGEVTGSFCPPPGFEHLTTEEFIELLEERVREREAHFRKEYRGRFLGVRKVRRLRPFDCPSSKEPLRTGRPALAPRLVSELIAWVQELRFWRRQHREASRAYRGGDHSVVFPFGTYWMKHFSPARVARAPAFT